MILYPAIDLKGGQCVRLLRGDMNQATVFNTDPAAQALEFVKQGATYLHIVDLDGAVAGESRNADAVRAILAAVKVPVQLGGGLRDIASITTWLERGVTRVILGTAAVTNPELVEKACEEFPGRIVIGVDAREGLVAVDGWERATSAKATDIAFKAERAGAAAIVYTDILRDGALQGANIEATVALARALRASSLARRVAIPVIASGGITSLADIKALKAHQQDGIGGVIVGRALYERRFELADALKIAES